jgi:site-specific DNA-adenine methylase
MRLLEFPQISQPFRYFGCKKKVLSMIDFEIPNCEYVCEPFFGSAYFSLRIGSKFYGAETNSYLVNLWNWLKKDATNERLNELTDFCGQKVNVKTLEIPDPEKTYLRINTGGLYNGQLSSWTLYPQFSLPIEETMSVLDRIHSNLIQVQNISFSNLEILPGSLCFIDPPYVGTRANYSKECDRNEIVSFIEKLTCPWIFTYGTDAKETFPEFNWIEVMRKKVPKRTGGTTERIEHITFSDFELSDFSKT